MAKRTLAEHWHELRYHMIAGLFWYLMGFVTWAGATSTFKYLKDNTNLVSAVLIDIAALGAIYVIGAYGVKLWASSKAAPSFFPPPGVIYRNPAPVALVEHPLQSLEKA